MNTNCSKRHQLVSAENHLNNNDLKKIKLQEVHQAILSVNDSFRNTKNYDFVKFCMNKSLRRFNDKDLQIFNDFTKSGKVLESILYQ